MKKFTMALCMLVSVQIATGQSGQNLIRQKSDCAPVTQRMMEQLFSVEKQLELQQSPEELACLNYICAQSYEFAAGQMPLRSQKALFNIEKYKNMRRIDQRVTVFDEASGLNVVLYSWNEVETGLINVRTSYQIASCD